MKNTWTVRQIETTYTVHMTLKGLKCTVFIRRFYKQKDTSKCINTHNHINKLNYV